MAGASYWKPPFSHPTSLGVWITTLGDSASLDVAMTSKLSQRLHLCAGGPPWSQNKPKASCQPCQALSASADPLGLAGFWTGGRTRRAWRSRFARWAGQDLDRSGWSLNWTKPAGDMPPCRPSTNHVGVLGALEPFTGLQVWVGSPGARRAAASRVSRRRDVLVPTRSWCVIERVLRPPWGGLRS